MRTLHRYPAYVLVAALLVVAAAFTACSGGTTPTNTPTVAPTTTNPTATATPTPAPDAFVLNITSPADAESVVSTPTITVAGQTRVDAAVSVNDQFLTVDANGNFSVNVPLVEGPNEIDVVASIASGDELSKVLTVIYAP